MDRRVVDRIAPGGAPLLKLVLSGELDSANVSAAGATDAPVWLERETSAGEGPHTQRHHLQSPSNQASRRGCSVSGQYSVYAFVT